MRLLVLVINITLSLSLLAYTPEMFAASKHKSSHTAKGKSKRQRSRGHHKMVIRDPGNVWDRIRSGMRIPKPMPPQAFSNLTHVAPDSPMPSDLAATDGKSQSIQNGLAGKYTALGLRYQLLSRNRIMSPSIATAPLQNYTRYGRQRLTASRSFLGSTNTSISQALQRQSKLLQPSAGYLTKDSRMQTRIRTQLAPPSALHRPPVISSQVISQQEALPSESSKSNNAATMPVPNSTLPSSAPTSNNSTQDTLLARQQSREEALWQQQAAIYGRVKKQINGYAQRPDYLHRIAERARPYLYHVVEELSKYNMPMELALLPIVESAYQSTALSPMSAAGIWQFIPDTGRDFNLVQNTNYDARLDVIASTRAAIRFLSGLRNHFNGDWLLALAAYNCGQGTVDAAINTNRAVGLKTDYWSLNLPAETMDYVPRLLAVAQIFANPATYGLRLTPLRNEPYFVKVNINKKADVDYLVGKDLLHVAQLANLDYGHFCRLNSGYINSKLTKDGPFSFLMPGANANQLRDRLDSIAKFLGQAATAKHTVPVKQDVSKPVAPVLLSEPGLPATDIKPTTIASPFVSLQVDDKKINESAIK